MKNRNDLIPYDIVEEQELKNEHNLDGTNSQSHLSIEDIEEILKADNEKKRDRQNKREKVSSLGKHGSLSTDSPHCQYLEENGRDRKTSISQKKGVTCRIV